MISARTYGWSSAGRFHHAKTQVQRFLYGEGRAQRQAGESGDAHDTGAPMRVFRRADVARVRAVARPGAPPVEGIGRIVQLGVARQVLVRQLILPQLGQGTGAAEVMARHRARLDIPAILLQDLVEALQRMRRIAQGQVQVGPAGMGHPADFSTSGGVVHGQRAAVEGALGLAAPRIAQAQHAVGQLGRGLGQRVISVALAADVKAAARAERIVPRGGHRFVPLPKDRPGRAPHPRAPAPGCCGSD